MAGGAAVQGIRETLRPGARIVVIGGGWIGLETAAAARTLGADVTVLEAAELPLLRVLGREVAEIFADLHRDHGVDLRCGVQVAELVVDAELRTSDPDIHAAGDVANAWHPRIGRHIRVEHWANARHQPRAAAGAMLGRSVSYDRTPYFYTDQYDLGMEYTGYVEPDGYDRVVFRGDTQGREFIAFWTSGGRVLAGMNVNVWDVPDAIDALVRSGRPVDPARLADPTEPLESLTTTP